MVFKQSRTSDKLKVVCYWEPDSLEVEVAPIHNWEFRQRHQKWATILGKASSIYKTVNLRGKDG